METAKRALDKARGADLKKFLNAMLDEVCRLTSSKIAYFATMNEGEDVLTMLAWSMSAMSNCAMINKPIVYLLEDMGLWGDCVRERRPIITNDYPNLQKPTKKGYPAGHVSISRHMNIPVFENLSTIVGILGVGNKSIDFADSDPGILTELAAYAWPIIKTKLQ